jgi:hypothetical protein
MREMGVRLEAPGTGWPLDSRRGRASERPPNICRTEPTSPMPNDPYLDASVRWQLKSGQISFREPRAAEVAANLLDLGLVTEVVRTIGAGKEADAFLSKDGSRWVVAKVYRLYRTSNRTRGAVKADGMGHFASREFELLVG